jgi:hypothetical protein
MPSVVLGKESSFFAFFSSINNLYARLPYVSPMSDYVVNAPFSFPLSFFLLSLSICSRHPHTFVRANRVCAARTRPQSVSSSFSICLFVSARMLHRRPLLAERSREQPNAQPEKSTRKFKLSHSI